MSGMPQIAKLPEPPYIAVIFTSLRTDGDAGYGEMAEAMVKLAADQPGFLGVESARGADGLGITVSYWASEDDVRRWRDHPEHATARKSGREEWYSDFSVRIARVERAYGKTA
jgi:heme-degrading monooxygenase HmoA